MTNIIFATTNKGKLREVKEIMKDTGYEVISKQDANITEEVEENGSTFEENAIIKAESIMKLTGCIVMADDSGLEVDYLDKAPGVYSARYMGEDTSYNIKNNHILELMEGVPEEKRTARFVSAIATAMPDGTIITTKATIEGIIGYKQEGDNGFGYDPIFFVPEKNMTTAQMSMEEKNKISHRGKALRLMKEKLLNMEKGIK